MDDAVSFYFGTQNLVVKILEGIRDNSKDLKNYL